MYKSYGDIEAAQKEVAFAYEKVPFFRNGSSPPNWLGAGGMTNVPLTSKVEYRKNFPRGILAEGRSVNDPYVNRMQSSGTSGDRLVSVVHAFKLADRMANCVAVNKRLEFLTKVPRIRTCRYAAPNCCDVECSNPNVGMEDRILQDGTLVRPVHHDFLTTPDRMLRI